MRTVIILLTLLVSFTLSADICAQYPLDAEACLQKTKLQCQWDSLSNVCLDQPSKNLGCLPTLNYFSCVAQKYDRFSNPILCYFGHRCKNATPDLLSQIDCNDRLSFFACISVTTLGKQCHWYNNMCQDMNAYNITPSLFQSAQEVLERCLNYKIQTTTTTIITPYYYGYNSSDPCQVNLTNPVNQGVCSSLNFPQCKQNPQTGYCELAKDNLNELICTAPGLNSLACISITTKGQQCIYKNGYCQNFESSIQNISCTSQLNREACLNINIVGIICKWTNKCQNYTILSTTDCLEVNELSMQACLLINGMCKTDTNNLGKCLVPSFNDNCDASGMSLQGCLNQTNPCIFNGVCKSLTNSTLNAILCSDQVNKAACLGITTPGQTCYWNTHIGICQLINVTQNADCNSNDHQNVNGNVCKAVQSPCKYNPSNFSCEISTPQDTCTAPFLNLDGCKSITKPKTYCQWNVVLQLCQPIKVIWGYTNCADLSYVNPSACSQVYKNNVEDNQKICLYSIERNGCYTLDSMNDEISCDSPGLNQFGCIKVSQQLQYCRWKNNKCQSLTKTLVASISCLNLQQVNAASCSLIESEKCKYEPNSHNCITSVDPVNDKCDTPGLNVQGCSSLIALCKFQADIQTCVSVESANESFYNTMDCTSSKPTKLICLKITNPQSLCRWDNRIGQCTAIEIDPINSCLDFNNVNVKVCASVKMQKLDPNTGICQWVQDPIVNSYNCRVLEENNQICTVPGMNIHACSAKTSWDKFCYFDNTEVACKEFGDSVFDEKSNTETRIFFAQQQLKCDQANHRGCGLIEQDSPTLLCAWDGICRQHDFIEDEQAQTYSCDHFSHPTMSCNRYVCQMVDLPGSYCEFDPVNIRCAVVTTQRKCNSPDMNRLSCLYRTTSDQCEWDQDNLKCLKIISGSTKVCDDPINEVACMSNEGSCIFDHSNARCSTFIATEQMGCMNVSLPGFSYNPQVCSAVIKAGENCFYDPDNKNCNVQKTSIAECGDPSGSGINIGSCIKKTLGECMWDLQNLKCIKVTDLSSETITCTSNVNRKTCINLKKHPCYWDEIQQQCKDFIPSDTKRCSDAQTNITTTFNAKSCFSITKYTCQYSSSNLCVSLNKQLSSCTEFAVNKIACLSLTNNHFCTWNSDKDLCETLPSINEITECPKNSNQGVCIQQTPNIQCQWDLNLLQCSEFVINKNINCDDGTIPSNIIINRKACTQIPSDYYTKSYTCGSQNIEQSQPGYCQYQDQICSIAFQYNSQCQIQYNTCNQLLGKDACLQLVTQSECYFDNTTQVCKRSNPTVLFSLDCGSANSMACYKITTPGQLCIVKSGECIYQQPTIQNQPICSTPQKVNPNYCQQIKGNACYWNSETSKCADTVYSDYPCDTPGLNQIACIYNTKNLCQFNETTNQCELKPNNINTAFTSCSQATNARQCSLVTDQSCYYDTITSQTTSSCVEITDFTNRHCFEFLFGANLKLCISIINDACKYDSIKQQCAIVNSDQSSCDNLNIVACLKNTQTLQCAWVDGVCREYLDFELDYTNSYNIISELDKCENLNKNLCLQLTTRLQCKFDLDNNICKTIDTTDTCTSLILANPSACSTQSSGFCYFSTESLGCVTITSQNQYQPCNVLGNNINMCLMRSYNPTIQIQQYSCLWRIQTDQSTPINACENLDESYSQDIECVSQNHQLNQKACYSIQNVNAQCQWIKSQSKCQQVIYEKKKINIQFFKIDPTNLEFCEQFAFNNQVNAITCASVTGNGCRYDPLKNFCVLVTATLSSCNVQGVNQIGCLTFTKGLFCQWQVSTKQCQDQYIFENDQPDYLLNPDACINLEGLTYYDTLSNTCNIFTNPSGIQQYKLYFLDVTYETVTNILYIINPNLCTLINTTGKYLMYNNTLQRCVDITQQQICNTEGINSLGCLSKTNQICIYDSLSAQPCQNIDQLTGFAKCPKSYNYIGCYSIQEIGCYFMNDQCQDFDDTKDCEFYSSPGIYVNQVTCALIQNGACQYNLDTNRCMIPTSMYDTCNIPGLNQIGCQLKTNGQCRFDKETSTCITDYSVDSFKCTDSINQMNCKRIINKDQKCQFSNSLCSDFPIQDDTRCPLLLTVNQAVCLGIKFEGCKYNEIDGYCELSDGSENCNDPTLNQKACLGITKQSQFCTWDTSNNQCTITDTTQANCIEPLNENSCINIQTAGQYCIWKNGQCQNYDKNAKCEEQVNINSANICAQSKESCKYDASQHKCVVVDSVGFNTCETEGLSKIACTKWTFSGSTITCQFDEKNYICNLPSDLTECSQAVTLSSCVKVLNNCRWDGTLCLNYSTTDILCSQVQQNVTSAVCLSTQTQSSITTCRYLGTIDQNFSCFEQVPQYCYSSTDVRSCIHMASQPCIWDPDNKQCKLFMSSPEQYNCNAYNLTSSKQACLNLVKIGAFCAYNSENQCVSYDPYSSTAKCTDSINQNACIGIENGQEKCIWNFLTGQVSDDNRNLADYKYGQCQYLKDPSLQDCSQYLNKLSCLSITKIGQGCQWTGSACNLIQKNTSNIIAIDSFARISSYVCSLVNKPGDRVKFDNKTNTCIKADLLNDDCNTPGINLEACMYLLSKQCKWDLINNNCIEFTSYSDVEECESLKKVNPLSCTSVEKYPCIYDFSTFGCKYLNLSEPNTCDAPGLNQLACLSIEYDTCYWDTKLNKCSKIPIIDDFTSCDNLPNLTNAYACSSLNYFTQLCKYDKEKKRCVSFEEVTFENCSTLGMNLQACLSVEDVPCLFSEGVCVDVDVTGYKCQQLNIANPHACAHVVQEGDTCKFDELSSKCKNTMLNDVCSTKGMNNEGCDNIGYCTWIEKDSACVCTELYKQNPRCQDIQDPFECSSRIDCAFDYPNTICVKASCSLYPVLPASLLPSSDVIYCQGQLDFKGRQCWAYRDNSCRAAEKCTDIQITPQLLSYYPNGCYHFRFNEIPCIEDDIAGYCKQIVCSNLDQTQCAQYDYCVYTQISCNSDEKKCLTKQCEDITTKDECVHNLKVGKACSWVGTECVGFNECSDVNNNALAQSYNASQVCESIKQGDLQCGWVQANLQLQESSCQQLGCRFIGQNPTSCTGTHILNQVCVFMSDYTCQACEEITDSCLCAEQSPFCQWNFQVSKCQSVFCNKYNGNKEECLSVVAFDEPMCTYNNKICSPVCSNLYNQAACQQGQYCYWDSNQRECTYIPPPLPKTIYKQPYLIFQKLLSTLVVVFFISML